MRLHDELTFGSDLFHLVWLCPDRFNDDVIVTLRRRYLVLIDNLAICVRRCLFKVLELLNSRLSLLFDSDLAKVRLTLLTTET